MSEEACQRCLEWFDEHDLDKKGTLSRKELYIVLEKAGFSAESTVSIFDEIDTDDDGEINKAEFEEMVCNRPSPCEITEANLRAAFKKCDPDGSGKITAAELQQICQDKELIMDTEEFDQMDKDADGCVCFEEFLAMWNKGNNTK